MRFPQKPKDVQSLTDRVVALSRFISKAIDTCIPFFKVLKGGKKFQWIEEREAAFQELKRYQGQAPHLSKAKLGKVLQLYLAVSQDAISAVLIREEGSTQLPKRAQPSYQSTILVRHCYPLRHIIRVWRNWP